MERILDISFEAGIYLTMTELKKARIKTLKPAEQKSGIPEYRG